MRLLLCLIITLNPIITYAKSYVVTSETTISTSNWYPLSEQEMKAAAVDTALSELTTSGQFEISRTDKKAGQLHDGTLKFDISLIGPAEIVKLALTLHLQDNVTYVSSVAMDIHGMDFRGIYDAFEYVGTEAAKRLNTKIAMMHSNNGNYSPGGTKLKEMKPNSNILKLFDQAQELKRKERFNEARALFEKVIEEGSLSDRQWIEMAADELRYGLPIFEADNILLSYSKQAPRLVQQKLETVAHLYRQILADNTGKPERLIEMNRRLDAIVTSRKALANAMKVSSLSRARSLQILLQQEYMSREKWPDRFTVQQEIHQFLPGAELVSYRSNDNLMELVIKDIKYGAEIHLTGNIEGIVEIK